MRSPKEIEQEIAKLKEVKPKVVQYSFFGDDNHASIEAQIEALEARMSDEDIYDKQEGGDWNDEEVDSARSAIEWMEGSDEDGAPSEGWPLIK